MTKKVETVETLKACLDKHSEYLIAQARRIDALEVRQVLDYRQIIILLEARMEDHCVPRIREAMNKVIAICNKGPENER